jgi:hypothetical protein
MDVEFYVVMNVSTTDDFDYEKRRVAKSVLYDANGKQILTSSELAYSSNEMLLISVRLWQPEDRGTMIENNNQIVTKLVVYQFNSNSIQQSDPYTLTFKRNE